MKLPSNRNTSAFREVENASGGGPGRKRKGAHPPPPLIANSPQFQAGHALQQAADNSPSVIQAKTNQTLADESSRHDHAVQLKAVIQLGRKGKKERKKRGRKRQLEEDEEEGEPWLPPSEQPKFRAGFSQKVRQQVIRNTAPFDEARGAYVCPGCGKVLMGSDNVEKKFTFTTKRSRTEKTRVVADIDHYPVRWADIRQRLLKKKTPGDKIRAAYSDQKGLRALCHHCNESHKYEETDLQSGGSWPPKGPGGDGPDKGPPPMGGAGGILGF